MTHNWSRTISLQPFEESVEEISALVNELIELSAEVGIELDFRTAEFCLQHLLYVNQVNKVMNLTRIKDIHDALVLHIVDSLALYRSLPIDPDCFLDMGTGAGFPGIPFALLTESSGVLLDSVGKKIDAVNAFIDALGIENLVGVHDRCESYAAKMRNRFDTVFARAVGQMSMIIEYGTPFLEDGGYLVVAKANPDSGELELAEKTADICGLELVGCDEFDLPRGLGHRSVYLYEKISEPRVKLPRAVGLAKKQPLAS